MDIKELRSEIDEIDSELVALFLRRMEISARIGAYKHAKGLPISVPQREEEKLRDVTRLAGPGYENDIKTLYSTIFALSRSHQEKLTQR